MSRLKRQSNNNPNFEEMTASIKWLEEVLEGNHTVDEWKEIIEEILDFQEEDGSLRLLDSWEVESDARVDFCYYPTYLGTAILMRALNEIGETGPDFFTKLSKGLNASTKRSFHGHGYESQEGLNKALEVYRMGGADQFVKDHPEVSPEFTSLYKSYTWHPVFTYGTLMCGRTNHYMMEGADYIGQAQIDGYAMYDLGSYPGIKEQADGSVLGELYAVDDEKLKELDRFEGNGWLYERTAVSAKLLETGEEQQADVYVYCNEVKENSLIPDFLQPYRSVNPDKYIWYVTYGSNLLEERFLCYIRGTGFRGRDGRWPCEDQSDPLGSIAVIIPHDLYFANESGSWDHKGVAFLDVDNQGETLGRAWLITKKQYKEVHAMEGNAPAWYGREHDFKPVFGISARTFTKVSKDNENDPSEEYINVIKEGIAETNALPGPKYVLKDC